MLRDGLWEEECVCDLSFKAGVPGGSFAEAGVGNDVFISVFLPSLPWD